MGKSKISITIFNSYVNVYQRVSTVSTVHGRHLAPVCRFASADNPIIVPVFHDYPIDYPIDINSRISQPSTGKIQIIYPIQKKEHSYLISPCLVGFASPLQLVLYTIVSQVAGWYPPIKYPTQTEGGAPQFVKLLQNPQNYFDASTINIHKPK